MSETTVLIRQLWCLTQRDLRRWYRGRLPMLTSFLQPFLWLALFGIAMGSFVGTIEGIDYFSFLAVGLLIMTAITVSSSVGNNTTWDRRIGFMDQMIAAPMPRWVIPLSRVLSATLKVIIQTTLILIIAVLMGLKLTPSFGFGGLLGIYAAVVCTSLIFATIFVAIGLALETPESLGNVNIIFNMPLMFASGIMYPTTRFPGWLKTIADANPLTWAADALRKMCLNVPADLSSLTWISAWGEIGMLALLAVATLLVCIFVMKMSLER